MNTRRMTAAGVLVTGMMLVGVAVGAPRMAHATAGGRARTGVPCLPASSPHHPDRRRRRQSGQRDGVRIQLHVWWCGPY